MLVQIDIDNSKPIIDFAPATTFEEIKQNIRNICYLVKGSVPYQRDMGFNEELIDQPVEQVVAIFQIDLVQQVKLYEPRASIVGFNWKGSDIVNGNLTVKLNVKIKEEFL